MPDETHAQQRLVSEAAKVKMLAELETDLKLDLDADALNYTKVCCYATDRGWIYGTCAVGDQYCYAQYNGCPA